MMQPFIVEVSVSGNDATPAQTVLGGPCERANAATHDIHGTGSDSKERRLLEHTIFRIESVSEI